MPYIVYTSRCTEVSLSVYHDPMARTNIDIDDELLGRAMELYGLATKREAVNYALERLVGGRYTPKDMLDLEGIGWEGDLDEMRRDGLSERIRVEEAAQADDERE
jgi:Arc/MetJ family transcription regulator